jgi:hypothetical protein
MTENIFKADAKQIVDMAFDAKLFKEEITRDHINSFEEYIGFLLQSRYDGYVRTKDLFDTIDKSLTKKEAI